MDCDFISTDFGAMSMRSVPLRASKVGRLHGFLSSVFGERWNQMWAAMNVTGGCATADVQMSEALMVLHACILSIHSVDGLASERHTNNGFFSMKGGIFFGRQYFPGLHPLLLPFRDEGFVEWGFWTDKLCTYITHCCLAGNDSKGSFENEIVVATF